MMLLIRTRSDKESNNSVKMGNSNSSQTPRIPPDMLPRLQSSLAAFNRLKIPSLLRQTFIHLLRSAEPTVEQWYQLECSFSNVLFVKAFHEVSNSNDLQLFFRNIAAFVDYLEDRHEYAGTFELDKTVQYLIDSSAYFQPLTIEQELDPNTTRTSIIPTLLDVDRWLSSIQVQKIMRLMFLVVFRTEKIFTLPKLQCKSQLISKHDMFVLDLFIKSKEMQWNLSFSSQRDGHSWASFLSRIQSVGAMLIIVKDDKGNLFGGYTSNSIVKSTKVS